MKTKHQILSALGVGAIMLFAQCGGESIDTGAVAMLQKEKDSLRQVKKDVASRINEIEDQLKMLDTTGNHNVPVVSIADVKSEIFKHYFQVQGVVETDKNASINAEASAKIVRINVKEGAKVRKGQVLIELDSKVIMNNIEELKTQIDLAKTIYEKQKSLWDQNIGSEVQYLEAKTNKESLERRLEVLYAQLEFYKIEAPFDGLVDEIFPKMGEMAMPGMPLLRVINLDNMYLKADVSEDYFGKIKEGDTAFIKFNSNGLEIKSSIDRIGNYINPNNRTFKIRFEIENESGALIPNMLAVVRVLDYSSDQKRVIVPNKLIQETPQGDEFVYVLKENGSPRAEKVMIESGFSYKGESEILKGLQPDHKLITKGARTIKDGEIVQVRNI